jgi:ADP-heptose:LPS heptosyltransferase
MTGRVLRILIVLDDAGPGDALRSQFVLSSVRQAHPEAAITLLADERALDVFSAGGAADRMVASRLYRRGAGGRWPRRLHKAAEVVRLLAVVGLRHDLVLVLNWGTLTLDVLGRLAGRRLFGYENGMGFLVSGRLGTYDVDGDPVEQNRAILRAAGMGKVAPAPPPVERRSDGQPYAVLHTGSDWACQQWRQERWAELGDRLVEEFGLAVVFTGLADETDYVTGVQALMQRPSTSLAGSTSIDQMRALLANASLCVTVDSAPYELAQLVRTPVVVIAGPTSARPQMGFGRHPVVINKTPPEMRRQIMTCQRTFAEGNCHDYSCPLSQLPMIDTEDVVGAVSRAIHVVGAAS